MVNPTSCGLNNNSDSTSIIKKDNHHTESYCVDNKAKGEFSLIEFNHKREEVKEHLSHKINDFIHNIPAFFSNNKSPKESEIINENHYTRNVNNARQLEKNIDYFQKIEAEIDKDDFSTSDSLRDFFNEVKMSIVTGKNDYLDILKTVFSNYMSYTNDLREAISSLSQYSTAADKEGYISVNFQAFKDKLSLVKHKYKELKDENTILYSNLHFEYKENHGYSRLIGKNRVFYKNSNLIQDAIHSIERVLIDLKGINTRKTENKIALRNNDINVIFSCNVDFTDLNKFIKEINTVPTEVKGILSDQDLEEKRRALKKDNTSILGFVRPGFNIENEMREIIKENNLKKEKVQYRNILQTEFDLFKKSLDSLEKKINSNLEELSKKYSTANSNFDNFVKIISSTMTTLLEMAKSFLRF